MWPRLPRPDDEYLLMLLFAVKSTLLFTMSWSPNFFKLKFLPTNLREFSFSFR